MSTVQENQLEQLLRLAANEPGHRAEFCEKLLQSMVYVLGERRDAEQTENQELTFQHWQNSNQQVMIPFFTSLNKMQQVVSEGESYLSMPCRQLFQLTLGEQLYLNPELDVGKAFTHDEINHLLDGEEIESQTLQPGQQLLIGQPARYPKKMVDSLKILLSKHYKVKNAYLALIHDKKKEDRPHLVVGLETEGEMDTLIEQAGQVATETTDKGEVVDWFKVNHQHDQLSDYMLKETHPFYHRSLSTTVKSWFGSGMH